MWEGGRGRANGETIVGVATLGAIVELPDQDGNAEAPIAERFAKKVYKASVLLVEIAFGNVVGQAVEFGFQGGGQQGADGKIAGVDAVAGQPGKTAEVFRPVDADAHALARQGFRRGPEGPCRVVGAQTGPVVEGDDPRLACVAPGRRRALDGGDGQRMVPEALKIKSVEPELEDFCFGVAGLCTGNDFGGVWRASATHRGNKQAQKEKREEDGEEFCHGSRVSGQRLKG